MALWQLTQPTVAKMDPLGGYKDGIAIRAYQAEQAQKMRDAELEQQRKSTLAALLQQNTDEQGNTNMGRVAAGLAQAGYGDAIPGLQKAWLENDNTRASMGKAQAETVGFQQKSRDAVRSNLLNMVRVARNPAAASLVLNSQQAREAFAPEELQALVSGMPIEPGADLQPWQDRIATAQTSPDQYYTGQVSLQNNAANNATTQRGQDMTAETARNGQQVQMQITAANNATSRANNADSNAVQLQRLRMEQNRGQLVTGADGNAYIFYPALGKYERYLGSDGQAMPGQAGKVKPSGLNTPETPEQRMERQINANKAADAAQQAENAAQEAEKLLKHPGLEGATGSSRWMAILPGDARDFKAQLATLKAQVFMPAIQQMKGMGPLSNAEGAKVEATMANLEDMGQTEAQMKRSLAAVAAGMRRLAALSRQEAQIYATRGGTIQPQQDAAPASAPAPAPASPAPQSITLAEAKATAQQTGMRVTDVIAQLKQRGITVR